jgi:hypothetical protein
MTHLNPDELIDAMEGLLSHERQEHLSTCEHCQRELADLSSVLNEAKQVSMPEPSPLFWQHFSQRVRTAIDTDAASDDAWPSWLRWQVLLPLGAVAMIILALMISVPKQDAAELTELAVESPQAVQGPDSWATIEDLVGELDVETASATGVIEPGIAEQAVLALTADEQQELTRLLKAELTRAKS